MNYPLNLKSVKIDKGVEVDCPECKKSLTIQITDFECPYCGNHGSWKKIWDNGDKKWEFNWNA
ncbi:MAG: hydrogenase maturation nickel metallochaperone HypA [Deltaproteobacteria bacterium]|nr:hydrogenase maturation nickel metallochaperone HypA [Deltaproteobacteria bacterium]